MLLKIWIDIVTLVLIVLGALNWGLVGAFKFNAVQWLAKRTTKSLETVVYIIIGLAALVHLFSRDYYLQFLGRSAFPCNSLVSRAPQGADMSVVVNVEPNVNVIYWAAEPNTKVQDNPWIAYNEYANAGVTRSDASGNAILKFRAPAQYKVSMGMRTLKSHVHYRVCKHPGLLGRVETVMV